MNLTNAHKDIIKNYVNPQGSNYKNVNFFRLISETDEGVNLEIGYWITYLNCRPKYNKDTIYIKKSILN